MYMMIRSAVMQQPVVRDNLSVLVENDVMTQQEADAAAARISFVDTIEEVADFADVVFEGIIEKLEIKQDYFAKMDAIFPPTTILATNTSAISITEIAEKSVHKERIIGTHYWNPAYLVPLVEVIKTKYVSDETVQATYDLLKEAGKRPVIVKKDVPGFLANRMQHALFREALNIIEQDIADPADVDDAIKYGFGMRLGICAPVEVMDMGGLDLTYNIHSYLFPHLCNSTEPSKLLTDNIAKGNLGFKTGQGLETWSERRCRKSKQRTDRGTHQSCPRSWSFIGGCQMRDVVIVAGCRTPIGTIGGQFKTLAPVELTIPVMQNLIKRAGIDPVIIDDVIWGCNYQRTYKENNLARVAAVKAGLPVTVPGITIHRNCTSSMSAIQMGFYQIRAGEAECIMAGGSDSMSTAPHMVFNARYGQKYGHMEMRDSMWDSLTNLGVGTGYGYHGRERSGQIRHHKGADGCIFSSFPTACGSSHRCRTF